MKKKKVKISSITLKRICTNNLEAFSRNTSIKTMQVYSPQIFK